MTGSLRTACAAGILAPEQGPVPPAGLFVPERPTPPASASILRASATSLAVTPPESWVVRSTTTRFHTFDHSG